MYLRYMFCRWVPIKGNDWYWIRHHIKVGMNVVVEIMVSCIFTHVVGYLQCMFLFL